MAKNLKPKGARAEASYTINGYEFFHNYLECPLFDGRYTIWQDTGDAYWCYSNHYLDITMNENCSIYRLSQGDYYDEYHQQPFTIKQYVNNEWVDVTNKYLQTLNYRPVSWIKTMSNLPKGRYRFTSPCRMDAEWFIEKVSQHFLYQKDNTVYGMKTNS